MQNALRTSPCRHLTFVARLAIMKAQLKQTRLGDLFVLWQRGLNRAAAREAAVRGEGNTVQIRDNSHYRDGESGRAETGGASTPPCAVAPCLVLLSRNACRAAPIKASWASGEAGDGMCLFCRGRFGLWRRPHLFSCAPWRALLFLSLLQMKKEIET